VVFSRASVAGPHQLMRIRFLLFTLMLIRILPFTLMRIRILLLTFFQNWNPPFLQNDPLRPILFKFDADPDPAFHLDAAPDPAFHFDLDPDPPSKNASDPDPKHCLGPLKSY
jgi:hypothetical protein